MAAYSLTQGKVAQRDIHKRDAPTISNTIIQYWLLSVMGSGNTEKAAGMTSENSSGRLYEGDHI